MSRRTAPWQARGNAMQALLYPVENEREALKRQGLKPKDHAKDNRRMLQDMQRKTAEAKTQSNVSQDPFKMARFKGVESQVRQQMIDGVKHESLPTRPATAPTSYVRKGDGMRRRPTTPVLEKHESPRPKTSTKPRVPTRADCRMQDEMLRHSQGVDFVRKNALEAIRGSPSKQQDDENTPENTRHEAYGRVPSYLLKRKEEMLSKQEAEHHRLTEHPVDCPQGMRLMKDEERKQVLSKLDTSRVALLKELAGLPFVTDTPILQSQKAALEERLAEVEKALSLYSRPRVFVKV